MKALIQRVNRASVSVENETIGSISKGLVVFIGVADSDREEEARYLADKIVNLRIFSDDKGKFNLSSLDIHGELLIISQFTLMAETRKGRRLSFITAAPPEKAEKLFNFFVGCVRNSSLEVSTGRFQSHMFVEIINDGPVTIMLDSALKM